ncbi:hypothetical protein CEUSTIGMA_g7920.t1 [Chlamydomonas eustigma]|uniref:Transcription initiation factor IIB n=1 Tax=Chlamydomonas eustigma TaxID=1157962 RepID=A0A250XC86_9CHLO|nr:hypothetical protein CEUSTIGMA_g7920.t1 [Chlamydomonas eustigma]|eukprot:GAX80482.1 hypothetical protein CEUSTIGMA_g7920.t1 [Chlamydomonas eustigma]
MSTVQKCPDCGGYQFVEDHAAGDIVCKGCGLVVESHIIDERSEWRTFSDKDKDTADPSRVGGPSNPLLEGGGLSTVIGKAQNDPLGLSYSLNRLHTRGGNNPERNLITAFKKISDMCDQLSLVATIKDRACELYRDAMKTGSMRGKNMQAVAAGCLYLACRTEGNPRTFKEITAVLPSEVQRKDIARCFKDIVQAFKDKVAETGEGSSMLKLLVQAQQHAADYVRRYTAELKLNHQVFRACQDAALAATPKENGGQRSGSGVRQAWDSRSPLSVAAAIIYAITQLCPNPQDRVNLQHIVVVTGVAEATIRGAYRDLYPELHRLVPKYHAKEEAIRKLPTPNARD